MPSESSGNIPSIRPKFEVMTSAAARFPGIDLSAIETALTLLSAMSDVLGAMDLHYSRHGLSRGRFVVLVLLVQDKERGYSPAELAERAGVTRATMTGLIDTLEQAGLVQRADDPKDRRMYRILITAKGQEVLSTMLPDHFRRMAGLMRHLSEDERTQFRSLLEKMQQGVDAVREE